MSSQEEVLAALSLSQARPALTAFTTLGQEAAD
jgi:hypothetical protein